MIFSPFGQKTDHSQWLKLCILATLFSMPLMGQRKPTLAILDFEARGISVTEASVLTGRLGTTLVQQGYFQIIERAQMNQILQEQDFQMSGCTTDECAVEIGQLLGAELILAGAFGRIGETFSIDMRIIDIEKGSILKTASYDTQGRIDDVLMTGIAEAARLLIDPEGDSSQRLPEPAERVTLAIHSTPVGAEVQIDGYSLGITPLETYIEPINGKVAVRLLHEGYRDADSVVTVDAGDNLFLQFQLDAILGNLTVAGMEGSRIKFDGKTAGLLPLAMLTMPVGSYLLKAAKPGYYSYSENISISESVDTRVVVAMRIKPKRNAMLLSAILPGSGQIYSGKRSRGAAYLAGAAILTYLSTRSNRKFADNYDHYKTNQSLYNKATTAEDVQYYRSQAISFHQLAQDDLQSRNLFLSAFSALWVVNFIDINLARK